MKDKIIHVKDVIEVGPRHVTRIGGRAAVYLGHKLNYLIGKDVIVIIKVIENTNPCWR